MCYFSDFFKKVLFFQKTLHFWGLFSDTNTIFKKYYATINIIPSSASSSSRKAASFDFATLFLSAIFQIHFWTFVRKTETRFLSRIWWSGPWGIFSLKNIKTLGSGDQNTGFYLKNLSFLYKWSQKTMWNASVFWFSWHHPTRGNLFSENGPKP